MRNQIEIAKPNQTKKKRKSTAGGFSLIELLVVVAVILIIASIAIPNFIRSKMRANETGAAANLRTISTAEVVYSTTYGIGYSPTLVALAGNPVIPDATQAGLIDSVLGSATGIKSGYQFIYTVITSDPSGHVVAYSLTADPTVPGTTGDRHFYTDQTCVIRANGTGPASATDPSI